MSNFFADVSSKIIALADPVLSQPDMERDMVSPPAGAYIPSFTIYHVLPDLPESRFLPVCTYLVLETGVPRERVMSYGRTVFGTSAHQTSFMYSHMKNENRLSTIQSCFHTAVFCACSAECGNGEN